jgi:hypothetical protein
MKMSRRNPIKLTGAAAIGLPAAGLITAVQGDGFNFTASLKF